MVNTIEKKETTINKKRELIRSLSSVFELDEGPEPMINVRKDIGFKERGGGRLHIRSTSFSKTSKVVAFGVEEEDKDDKLNFSVEENFLEGMNYVESEQVQR